MWLYQEAMGCGRSKQQSPSKGDQEQEVYTKADSNKKKKPKDERKTKELSNTLKGSSPSKTLIKNKTSPIRAAANLLKPPSPGQANGSSKSPQFLHVDVEIPPPKMDKTEQVSPSKAGSKDGKEFTGRKNIKVTHSQIEFFRMLDEKIAEGEDYRSVMGSRVNSRLNSQEQSLDEMPESPPNTPEDSPRHSLSSLDECEPILMRSVS
ncbi:uncharacterized protein LOC128224549 [Mya arenaria]|uniref:uncharacterized protein LOC128224549 n=1 Tax=Mya arenaria TaxID=6604 RepID=UPI0022E160C1|nr:uncharacterized protein LOC128224549 [Mya arenaria]